MPDTSKPVRRIRIENDGNTLWPSTKITDANTGEELDRILHCRLIDIDGRHGPTAVLWSLAAIDITADAEIVEVCPQCGQQQPSTNDNDYRLQQTINDVDLDMSMKKLRDLQELQRSTRDFIDPAEALAAFVEWLMECSKGSGPFGAFLTEAGLTKMMRMFNEVQGWYIDDKHYEKTMKRLRDNYPD